DLALANEAKTRFLAAASHDLRQPIHALALFVGQLRANAGSPRAPALLEKIELSVEALEDLLEALLDLSKLDVGAVTPQPKPFAKAIRYPADGRVLIGCRRRGENVDLVVADTGLGIAPVHLPHVFQEFYQAGPLQGGLTKGLGLGLAIVKRLGVLLDHCISL